MTHPGIPDPMDTIHALSPRGEEELQRGMTTLSASEIEILVRLDGQATLRQVRAGMPQVQAEQFDQAVRNLQARELLTSVERDPVAARLQADLARMQRSTGRTPDANTPAHLQTSSFRVGIARPRSDARRAASDRALTALVVEDEPTLARFIKCYLAFEGIESRLAANREQLQSELRKLPVADVILLDVKLPDVDGFDVLKKLRAHAIFQHTPVILLTGMATRAAVIQGMSAGADGYLTKPFQAESLVKAVRTVLGLPDEAAEPEAADPWKNWDTKTRREPALTLAAM